VLAPALRSSGALGGWKYANVKDGVSSEQAVFSF
jgi:hypothetical protein